MAAGAVSLRKSHDILILSFCDIVKGQANSRTAKVQAFSCHFYYLNKDLCPNILVHAPNTHRMQNVTNWWKAGKCKKSFCLFFFAKSNSTEKKPRKNTKNI